MGAVCYLRRVRHCIVAPLRFVSKSDTHYGAFYGSMVVVSMEKAGRGNAAFITYPGVQHGRLPEAASGSPTTKDENQRLRR